MDNSVTGHDLSVGYDRNEVLLSGIDLSLKPGEIVAINGASGVGKNNSLRTFAGLLNPLEGRISIFAKEKAKARRNWLHTATFGIDSTCECSPQCHAKRYSRPHICFVPFFQGPARFIHLKPLNLLG